MWRTLTAGNGGWVLFQSLTTRAFLRYRRAANGRYTLRELYFPGRDEGVSSQMVQRLPLSQIEAWVNEPETARLIELHEDEPSPDLATAASYFTKRWSMTPAFLPHYRKCLRNWADDMLLSQYDDWSDAVEWPPPADIGVSVEQGRYNPMSEFRRPVPPADRAPIELSEDLNTAVLKLPSGRSYPDDFYDQVADIYRQLALKTRAPAPIIATANDVPVSTVHRWIKEARKRGKLAPGTPGKAG